jgi:hypothetical protein
MKKMDVLGGQSPPNPPSIPSAQRITGKPLAFQKKSCIILPGRESYTYRISVTEMLVFSQDE